MARRLFSPFLLLLDAKNRLSISEMVSAQSLQKVWSKLKKKRPYVDNKTGSRHFKGTVPNIFMRKSIILRLMRGIPTIFDPLPVFRQ